jgi:hypothetical protein
LENQAPHLTRVLGRADLTFFLIGALSFLIPALLLFRWNARRDRIPAVVPAKVVPD